MKNLFDETFDVSNEELVSIDEEFSLLMEGLKVDILLANLTVSLVSVSDFISNYTDHIQPAKENASYNVGNITSLIEEIRLTCGELPDNPCDTFLHGVEEVLDNNIDQIPLPVLPVNIENIPVFIIILKEIETQLDKLDLIGDLSGLVGQIRRVRQEFEQVPRRLEEVQALVLRDGGDLLDLPSWSADVDTVVTWVLLAVPLAVALLLTLLLLGATCGGCSRQGGGPARSAAGVMRCSLTILFFMAAILGLLCSAIFLVGGISHKAVCNSLQEPEDSQILELVDRILMPDINNILFQGTSFHLSVVQIIQDIRANSPLYPLLHLDLIFDVRNLDDWRQHYNIESFAEDCRAAVEQAVQDILRYQNTVLSPTIVESAADIDRTLNPVIPQILNIDLSSIAGIVQQIETVIASLPAGWEDLNLSLYRLISELEALQVNTRNITETFQTALNNDFADGSALTLQQFLRATFNLLDNSFTKIEADIPVFVENIIQNLLETRDTNIPGIVEEIEQHIGQTGKLNHLYEATFIFLCQDLLDPCNSGNQLFNVVCGFDNFLIIS